MNDDSRKIDTNDMAGRAGEDDAPSQVSRRSFLATAGAAIATSAAPSVVSAAKGGVPERKEAATRKDAGVRVVHSVCLACNAHCGVRGVVEEGRLTEVTGNPYHPYNMRFRPLDYDAPVSASLDAPSPVCGKCLDTANHTYSPYRLLKPLKRSGPRGSGKFEPIEWETLIRELADGGKLFAHLGEDRHVEGLGALVSDDPIDPGAPELGPKRNGFVFVTGRLQAGRQQFIDRFVKGAVGSVNRIGHTDICGLGFRMGNFAMTEKKQIELKADPMGASYMLVFGANIYEALQPGINTYGALVSRRRADGELRFAVADPRATNASAHADEWMPVKPGGDGALAMGVARVIIENGLHNVEFLSAPNIGEAKKRGFGACSNAPCLVVCDPLHPANGKMLRFKDLDPSQGGKRADELVALSPEGEPVAADVAERTTLDAETALTDYFGRRIKVKTVWKLFRDEVMSKSLDDYAAGAGLPAEQIERVGREFAAHGTRAAVTQYHGAGNYVSGVYAAYAVAALNLLVGSVDMRGGYMKGGGGAGDPESGLFDLKDFPGKAKPSGAPISREKFAYEKTTEYRRKKAEGKAYPARRPWFPFSAGGLSTEALSGMDARYPYPCKILFTYLYNGVYSAPGGYRFKETLLDPARTPLHVSLDVAVNETNIFADYVVPDLCYPEGHYGWLTPHAPALKFTGVRTPIIEPLTGKTADGRPFCTETLLIDLAVRLKLPGFGDEAIPAADKPPLPLRKAEDFYLRAFANIAQNAKLAPASDEEVRFVEENYPVAKRKDVLDDDQWRRVCRMLARGGVFRSYESVFEGNVFKHGVERYALYNEELGTTKDSLTGKRLPGVPTAVAPTFTDGRPMDEIDAEYPFTVVTYKKRLHTQSRSLWFSRGMEIDPVNFVELNETDARALGVKNGDKVRLVSASNKGGVEGAAKVTKLIRPGCVGVSFHYGHTQFGASRLRVKDAAKVFQGGATVTDKSGLVPNPAFKAGLNPNDVARLDETLGGTPLVDTVAGIPDFSSTKVRISKV